jgi:hypothetical protein
MVEVKKHTDLFLFNLKKYDLGWTLNSRKTHQTIVNMLAEYLLRFI